MEPKDYTKEYIITHADSIDWKLVSEFASIDVISEISDLFAEDLVFRLISKRELSEEFVRKFFSALDWFSICKNSNVQNYSESFFKDCRFNTKTFFWFYISQIKNLSEDFLEKHFDNLDLFKVISNSSLSEDFIRKYQDRLDWLLISEFQVLSNSFKEEFKDKLNFEKIQLREENVKPEDYTFEYISKFANNISWPKVSTQAPLNILSELADSELEKNIPWVLVSSRNLTEDFIKKYKDKLSWDILSILMDASKYSQEFYEIHSERIDWNIVSQKQLPLYFIRKHAKKLNLSIIEERMKIDLLTIQRMM